MAISPWWNEQCPKRGPALSHAHWKMCQGEHPEENGLTGRKHGPTMCCYCEQTPDAAAPTEKVNLSAATADGIPVEAVYVDPARPRPTTFDWTDLTGDELLRLSINCVEAERRRGYR